MSNDNPTPEDIATKELAMKKFRIAGRQWLDRRRLRWDAGKHLRDTIREEHKLRGHNVAFFHRWQADWWRSRCTWCLEPVDLRYDEEQRKWVYNTLDQQCVGMPVPNDLAQHELTRLWRKSLPSANPNAAERALGERIKRGDFRPKTVLSPVEESTHESET